MRCSWAPPCSGGREWLWLSCRRSSSAWTGPLVGRAHGPTEVAASVGLSRVWVHAWAPAVPNPTEGVTGLADRPHRPRSCPHQASDEVAVRVAEMRRIHPRLGAKRIRMELLEQLGGTVRPVDGDGQPDPDPARPGHATEAERPRDSYQRWERPEPMQLWQLGIVGDVWLVDSATGVLREVKLVTGLVTITPGSA